MSPVAAPADKRFRRAHVKPARRRQWRSLTWRVARYAVLAAIGLYAAYRGAGVAAHARLLHIDRIVVHGNNRLSSGDVLAVLNGLRGENLLRADLDTWRQRLLASPWIKDAALRRSLPSTIEVAVAEREPIGVGRIDGMLYLVDDRGLVIDEYGPQYASLDLPIVDGLSPSSAAEGGSTDDPRAELAARLIASLRPRPDVARRLSQVDVTDLHNAAVILSGDSAVVYVGEDRFLPRLQSYIELADALRQRVPDIDYVDLRFEDRIYVRPGGQRKGSGTIALQASSWPGAGGRLRRTQ